MTGCSSICNTQFSVSSRKTLLLKGEAAAFHTTLGCSSSAIESFKGRSKTSQRDIPQPSLRTLRVLIQRFDVDQASRSQAANRFCITIPTTFLHSIMLYGFSLSDRQWLSVLDPRTDSHAPVRTNAQALDDHPHALFLILLITNIPDRAFRKLSYD